MFLLSWFFFTTNMASAQNQVLPPAVESGVDFARDIAPILQNRCQSCHGPDQQMSGLRLDTREGLLKGGYSGPSVRVGESAASLLIHLVAGRDETRVMPMGGERLTGRQIGLLRTWLDRGARWPERPQDAEEFEELRSPLRKQHWAFTSFQRPAIPLLKDKRWSRNAIDSFVLAKLEQEGMTPSPQADRSSLIRRVSLDLIGLPPTPREIEQFLSDDKTDAYERLVDRLLASEHYGEKWALHWLDQARFGESDGYQADFTRPAAWRWRHWVIDALNGNMPFDQFTIEQIAGDLLPDSTVDQRVATGFHRNTLTNRESGFPLEMDRVEQVFDRINTVGTVWLGLTVGCARCHDHKFDPLTQKEYYELYSFFNTATEVNIVAPLPAEMTPYLEKKQEYDRKWHVLMDDYNVHQLQAEWESKVLPACLHPDDSTIDLQWKVVCEELRFEVDGIHQSRFSGGEEILRIPSLDRPERYSKNLTRYFINYTFGRYIDKKIYEELGWDELKERLKTLEAQYPALSVAQTITDNSDPPDTHILLRGDFRSPGLQVQPNTPSFLPPLANVNEPNRLVFARWLVSKENPLTARVTVNRMWQEFFGNGLVTTSEDFGTRGEKPSHPKLLDWLTTEFIDNGWNVKAMHKLIVTSATYRQGSMVRLKLQSRDPSNRLLARQARLRLSAELVRDAALAASGLLDRRIGGHSIRPVLPGGATDLGFGDFVQWPESTGADKYRRGLYIFRQRTLLYPQLMTFDAPNTLVAHCHRERSTTPLQALTLLNDPVFFEAAQGLASRILNERQGSVADRIDYAFQVSLGRTPRAEEQERMLVYYHEQKRILHDQPEPRTLLIQGNAMSGIDPIEAAVWIGISSVLLNLEEFITRD
tara:strand:+ start:35461 stop:38082 length:2622 start_codon:yes stop_codon:yes gene_type:complete